ncbi:unnamed protein product [Ilex paraguariensis]|uniref:CUE domain-containing protein n=1 Tax=Ilex paraguariensis TaxID=185542 RepID=A0ABC8UDH9_9AQUA
MKAGTSTLNPYAASYVPLSKRGAADGNKDYKSGNEAVWLGPHSEGTTKKQQQIAEDPTLKGYPVQGFYGSSSHNPREMTEKHTMDEVFDMDLAYLQMTFPGVSDESLFDVYLANKGDLEATIDMLNQLEDSVTQCHLSGCLFTCPGAMDSPVYEVFLASFFLPKS